MTRGKALVALAVVAAIPLSGTANARPNVVRVSTIRTDNCNDPATLTTPAGLCQPGNNNPTQPGGGNPDVINARVRLVDNGITLVGVGNGNGFRPGATYVSLVYLNPTVQTCARFPVGQAANTANTANADNDFNSMFLGFWVVNQQDGTGQFSVYPGKLSPLGNLSTGQRGLAAYGTVSVREAAGGFIADAQGGSTTRTQTIINNIAAGRDIPPNIFGLRSCGSLTSP